MGGVGQRVAVEGLSRVERLRRLMERQGIEAMVVTKRENCLYLSGFTGTDGLVLVTGDRVYLVTDRRYTEQATVECRGWEVVEAESDYLRVIGELARGLGRVGFESRHLTYDQYLRLRKEIGDRLQPQSGLVEELRKVKDESEIAYIAEAIRIGDWAFENLIANIGPGWAERDIAWEMVRLLRRGGCTKEAFDIIAVSGPRASLPHGQPTDKRIEPGDMLTLDFGGFYSGYAGDTTRTVAIETVSNRLREVYYRVLEAQVAAIETVRAGVACREVDRAARSYLEKHGLGPHFVHSTGHGLGLEVHEEPAVSSKSEEILAENMVVTIEPGVYIPGWGGVRIEDVVIVKETGCEVLTKAEKELLIIQ